MLGMQFDPTLGLSLSRQRYADLIAEAHQQQLVQEALDCAPRRTPRPEQAARGRVASRRTGLVLASLLRTMSFAVRDRLICTDMGSWSRRVVYPTDSGVGSADAQIDGPVVQGTMIPWPR